MKNNQPRKTSGYAGLDPSRAIRLLAALALAAPLALPSVVLAQQWAFSPLVEVAAQYIDNPRLVESGQSDDISGGLLGLGAELQRNTQTSSVIFRPMAQIYRYGSDSNEDSEAFFLDFDASKRGQRSEWRLRANYRQQQVLRGETTPAEIDDIGVDDSVQTGTGQTFERRERDMLRLGPGVTLDFTERTALLLEANFVDVQYNRQELDEAVDYQNIRGDLGIVRALSPDSSLTFGVFAQKYDPDSASRRETDSIGVRALYRKEITDVSNFYLDVGVQDSDIQSPLNPATDISKNSFLWNIGYDRRWERTRWRFDIGQTVTPSGSGFMVERDLYRAIMQHQLRPRWTLDFSAVFMNTDTLGAQSVITVNDRDWLEGRIALGYQVTRTWTLEGMYRLTRQDFADIPGDAQEHEVRLSLVYRRPVPTS